MSVAPPGTTIVGRYALPLGGRRIFIKFVGRGSFDSAHYGHERGEELGEDEIPEQVVERLQFLEEEKIGSLLFEDADSAFFFVRRINLLRYEVYRVLKHDYRACLVKRKRDWLEIHRSAWIREPTQHVPLWHARLTRPAPPGVIRRPQPVDGPCADWFEHLDKFHLAGGVAVPCHRVVQHVPALSGPGTFSVESGSAALSEGESSALRKAVKHCNKLLEEGERLSGAAVYVSEPDTTPAVAADTVNSIYSLDDSGTRFGICYGSLLLTTDVQAAAFIETAYARTRGAELWDARLGSSRLSYRITFSWLRLAPNTVDDDYADYHHHLLEIESDKEEEVGGGSSSSSSTAPPGTTPAKAAAKSAPKAAGKATAKAKGKATAKGKASTSTHPSSAAGASGKASGKGIAKGVGKATASSSSSSSSSFAGVSVSAIASDMADDLVETHGAAMSS